MSAQTSQVICTQQCQEQSKTTCNVELFSKLKALLSRYSIQVAAKFHHGDYHSSFSKPLDIRTVSAKPHVPRIQSIAPDLSGAVLVSFDYPCPYTGPTEFRAKVECQEEFGCGADLIRDSDFENFKEGKIKVVI